MGGEVPSGVSRASTPSFAGYQAQLDAAAVSHALASGELHELFHTLFSKPLQFVEAPFGGPMVMCIDALDEVPVDTQSVSERLNVIVNMVPLLPHWLRIFVTSRDNHQVPPSPPTSLLFEVMCLLVCAPSSSWEVAVLHGVSLPTSTYTSSHQLGLTLHYHLHFQ